MRKLFIILLCFLAIFTFSCKKKNKASISLDENSIILYVGESYDIKVNVEHIDDPSFSYTLSNNNTISISNSVVTAIAEGSVDITISVKDYDVNATLHIEVQQRPALSITGNGKIKVGESLQLTAVLTNLSGNVVWNSENTNVCTVDNNGLVTALAAGTAVISCKCGEISQTVSVVVSKVDPTAFDLESKTIELFIGDEHQINVIPTPADASTEATYVVGDSSIVSVDANGLIKALAKGATTITITSKEVSTVSVTLNVVVKEVLPTSIVQMSDVTMEIKTEMTLKPVLLPEGSDQGVRYTSSNQGVAVVTNGVLKAFRVGTSKITVISTADASVKMVFNVTVIQPAATEINIPTEEIVMEIDGTYQLDCSVDPFNASQELDYVITDPAVASIDSDLIITALKIGETVLTISTKDGSNLSKTIKIVVEPKDIPEFYFEDDFVKDPVLNWNTEFDPMAGITAADKHDGDLTDKITVEGSVDNKTYGTYKLTYKVADSSGFETTLERNVTIVWNNKTKFIGHAGSYYGLMNSEEAILYALKNLHYQAIEVDLAQTSDGVFVLSHDATFGDYTIASTPWSTFANYEITKTRNAGYPQQLGLIENDGVYTTKLCRLSTYLDLCKEYGAKAVIELKSSNGITNTSQTRMPALMQEIKDLDMLDDVIFLASQYNCLIWTRTNGYTDIECQYLVNSIESESALQMCIDYNFTISTNVTYGGSNSDEWLARYKEAGCKISTWTFSQYNTYADVQTWIDKGVDYVTCDWHPLEGFTHHEKSTTPGAIYTVTFKDFDGSILKQAKVEAGETAAPPKAPERTGYKFIGWSDSITNVTGDMEVTAQYELIEYTITFMPNLEVVEESTWESKEEFCDEFYTDLFNFLSVTKISGLTYSDGTYTFTKGGLTATWKDVAELKAVDIYDFEKTVGTVIYKPLESRAADGSAVIEVDDNYFLNSTTYKEKYRALDAWFYNCIVNHYTTYNTLYKPTSAGKVQIMFRFHQWQKGTNIAEFNDLPVKYVVTELHIENQMPETITYTIESEITLPNAVGGVPFVGWYYDRNATGEAVTKINKGTTGNIVLYAKWDIK